jgi:hypothetical protein
LRAHPARRAKRGGHKSFSLSICDSSAPWCAALDQVLHNTSTADTLYIAPKTAQVPPTTIKRRAKI